MAGPLRRTVSILVVVSFFGSVAASAQPRQLPERAKTQIAALLADKAQWTPAQQKMDSQLIYAARILRGEPVVAGIAAMPSVFDRVKLLGGANIVELDIKAKVDDALLAALKALGAQIVSAFPAYGAVRAQLPIAAVEQAAALPAVRFIGPAEKPHFNRVHTLRSAPGSRPGTGAAAGPVNNTISSTEGDHAHAADVVRALGIAGAGVKVGVLSDGVDSLTAQQTAGALPAVTVLSGQQGSGDEGTAMLEIVHTLAPGAQLFYATGDGGEAQMASNITALQTAGCNVIVDDVTYFDEGLFQDSSIAQAVETVTAAGALYFSSAQNSGNFDSSTSGTWEGDFANSGVMDTHGTYHDFGGGNTFNELTASADFVSLKWSDPLGASANDYDLFITDSMGNIVASSTTRQTGTQDPFEGVNGQSAGRFVVVVKFSGAARALHVDTERGQLEFNTAGATFGHNAAAGGVTVAAVPVSAAGSGTFMGGTGVNVEDYSSDGFRRIFYQPNGTAITPGNFLIATNGGTVLMKPEITAADCVSTNVGGEFSPFCGTSAAAPHAGAIAALAESMPNHPTPAQVKAAMLSSALDIMAAGVDRDSGSGIVMANLTIATLTPPPTAIKFFTVTPCRIVDTRNANGPLGGPELASGTPRGFVLTGSCGIPTSAKAISVNVTITQPGAGGDLRLYNADLTSPPIVSTINFQTADTRANNAVLQLPGSGSGTIDVKLDSAAGVHFILDVNGYFQ
jgi:hypothetical protein